jgi:spoIIIJ-associated protein
VEYVEVRGKTVDVAVEAALQELGIDRDRAEIEIIQQPEKGFLGMGGKDALVRVKAKAQQKRRRRRRKGGVEQDEVPARGGRSNDQEGRRRNERGRGPKSDAAPGPRRDRPDRQPARRDDQAVTGHDRSDDRRSTKEETVVSIEEQAPVVEAFLKGLVESFGLDGTVVVTTEDDVIVADVSGPQTESMVGPRGSTIEAIHELTKTVLQRQTQASARLRLDIAGYAERRRQALAIYARQLIDQVVEEGGEVMLEPMSAGDRKTIHDTVAERDGVRSYSEGESPQRYVVIASTRSSSEEE